MWVKGWSLKNRPGVQDVACVTSSSGHLGTQCGNMPSGSPKAEVKGQNTKTCRKTTPRLSSAQGQEVLAMAAGTPDYQEGTPPQELRACMPQQEAVPRARGPRSHPSPFGSKPPLLWDQLQGTRIACSLPGLSQTRAL